MAAREVRQALVHEALGDDELCSGRVEIEATEQLVGPVVGGVAGQQGVLKPSWDSHSRPACSTNAKKLGRNRLL